MDEKETNELLEIWRTGKQEGWTGTAFNIVEEILRKRLGKPPQQLASSLPRARSQKILWLMITGGIGVMLIVAAVVLNAPSAEPAPTFRPSPTLTATPTETPTPTTTPTETPAATSAVNIPLGTIRPSTGVIKSNQDSGGYGELTVENGTTSDGVVILTLSDKPVMSAYIRSGDSFTMKGILDGTYYLYFSTGADWNGKAFTTTPSHQKFEDAFEFSTGSTTYTTWSVTLQGVVGGTAATENIDESQFPDIGD
jgi:hypothetical protein